MARDDETSGTHFLNVDLDVSTYEGLDDLVSFFVSTLWSCVANKVRHLLRH
jgi:hypothetical protein